jgi:hypothetical protein
MRHGTARNVVNVTVAYANPKWIAVVKAWAQVVGGPEVRCDVEDSNSGVAIRFATDDQAEEFRHDLREHLSKIAYSTAVDR